MQRLTGKGGIGIFLNLVAMDRVKSPELEIPIMLGEVVNVTVTDTDGLRKNMLIITLINLKSRPHNSIFIIVLSVVRFWVATHFYYNLFIGITNIIVYSFINSKFPQL